MTENNDLNIHGEPKLTEQDELKALKARADLMKISYHPNIGVDKLRAKLQEQLDKSPEQLALEKDTIPSANQNFDSPDKNQHAKRETPAERKIRERKKASRLIRIRLSCMNPAKKAWNGEVFTVSNSVAGTHKKFVPFHAPNGWHVPEIMVGMIKDRKFVEHYIAGKDAKGRDIKRHRLVPEFVVAELPPLTPEEIQELKVQQALSRSTEDI